MKLTPEQVAFIIKFRHRLKERTFIITTLNIIKNRKPLNVPNENTSTVAQQFNKNLPVVIHQISSEAITYLSGDIYTFNHDTTKLFVYVDEVKGVDNITDSSHYNELTKQEKLSLIDQPITVTQFKVLGEDDDSAPLNLTDVFTIIPGMVDNFNRPEELTSIGRLLLNQLLLIEPFGDIIPYINTEWNQKDIEHDVAAMLVEGSLNIKQFKHFIDAVYFLGHFTELTVPTLSAKSLTTSPEIKTVKAKLFEKYKGRLEDPNIIMAIEDELLAIDKAYLEGDPSVAFYDGIGKKAYNVHRKKLLLSVGGIESFDDGSTSYNFIQNSLGEGWNPEDFPTICNEIRKGSYNRGKETQKGGEQTLFVTRVFQNLKITVPDCGTNLGLKVTLTDKTIPAYYGRTVVDKQLTLITKENASEFINKPIVIRSPMYCKAESGFCYTCVGELFKQLSTVALGMLPMEISSTFTSASLAAMHGTKIATTTINYMDYFI